LKVGVLADIHGNSRALREVLLEARAARVEQLLILGDLVGYYYQAKEVLEELQGWSLTAVQGNHERLLAQALTVQDTPRTYHQKYGSALSVALKTLSAVQIAWLTSLPDSATISIDGVVLELCHGSPRDRDEYVYPDADSDVIDACLLPDRDFVLMGHTHYPMVVPRLGICLLNPGSVGQARDVGGFASWCLLDTDTRALRFYRTAYDAQSLRDEVRAMDPHLPMLASILTRNNRFIAQPSVMTGA
jgi:putative phosphoesterase